MSEDLIWNWISAVVGYTWYWWDDAVDRDWSKCFYVCLCGSAVAELFHVAHKLVDLYATSAVRTLRLLRLLPSRMFCIGLVCFLYCVPLLIYWFFLCTATYRYFLQLEMHARLICVIKLYLLTSNGWGQRHCFQVHCPSVNACLYTWMPRLSYSPVGLPSTIVFLSYFAFSIFFLKVSNEMKKWWWRPLSEMQVATGKDISVKDTKLPKATVHF